VVEELSRQLVHNELWALGRCHRAAWADWLDIPRHTFSAMFGAVIARGEDYRQVFQSPPRL
jgi:hypothetical protein